MPPAYNTTAAFVLVALNSPTEAVWGIGTQPTYTLNAGDTLSGTVSFAANESLFINDPYPDIYLSLNLNSGSAVTAGSVDLLGVNGQLNQSQPHTYSGAINSTSIPVLGWGSMDGTFTGFDYTFTVTSGNLQFSPNSLYVLTSGANDFSVEVAPEPSTFALAGLGCVSLFAYRRRK